VITCGISALSKQHLFGAEGAPAPSARLAAEHPERVSAEYSLLHALQKTWQLAAKIDIILFHTSTDQGRQAVKILEPLLSEAFNAKVTLREIPGLDVADPKLIRLAVGRYLQDLGQALLSLKESGISACFSPIGGYKVMTALGYLIGAFYGFPSIYLHEMSQDIIHVVPPIPLRLDPDFLAENAEFIRELLIHDVKAWRDLLPQHVAIVESHPYFFERVDDTEPLVAVNAFGRFICSQPEYVRYFATRFYLSEEVRKGLARYPSDRPFVGQQLGNLAAALKGAALAKHMTIHHEVDFPDLKGKDLKYALYKGTSNGALIFRAAWRYDADRDNLYINALWLRQHDDEYERQARTGHGLTADLGKFERVEF
jgi:putative CRISPR-associated protein (TIGR02619 family)